MPQLAKHLLEKIPSRINSASKIIWDLISHSLQSGLGLEETLIKHPPDSQLESLIVDATAELIIPAESQLIENVIAKKRVLRFSKLFPHLVKPSSGITVITTNYDRLIEIAAESSGYRVDTLFVGNSIGQLNAAESKFTHCRGTSERKVSGQRKIILDFAPHIRVFKPHGSLDWYQGQDGPISCTYPINLRRLIITPGLNKFKGGYEQPFDVHREHANREIDRASRFLIIGYGFNDEHLQTHLEPKLKIGKPTLILTRSISTNLSKLIPQCPGITVLSSLPNNAGTQVSFQSSSIAFPGKTFWDLNDFINEVLTP